MSTATVRNQRPLTVTSDLLRSKLLPSAAAALLGLMLLGVLGFAHVDVIHNAAHDVRHSASVPCH